MILKFWNPETKCWVYEDGIARVSQSAYGEVVLRPGRPEDGMVLPEGVCLPHVCHKDSDAPVEHDWIVGDLLKWAKEFKDRTPTGAPQHAEPLRLKHLYVLYRSGRDKTFLFRGGENDRVYLLNDQGKTIERL